MDVLFDQTRVRTYRRTIYGRQAIFLCLEIKCSVNYSGKRGGHKGSSLRYDQSRQVHLVCVCLVWCFVYTLLFIKSAAAAIIIWDYFFQITLRFKRKEARNLMFFCLLSPKCHLKEINSARWMCCFDSTHQDSKIRFYYRYSTQKNYVCAWKGNLKPPAWVFFSHSWCDLDC